MIATLILMYLAGLAEAIMDILNHRFSSSIFKDFNEHWWNPEISWKNKWKDYDHTKGEAFIGSSTVFVFITDAWHFFKFLKNTFICGAIISPLDLDLWDFILAFVIIKVVWRVSFECHYRFFKN